MKSKAIALFSGGLDSIIAVKIIQNQGIDVQGIAFETPFFGAQKALREAEKIKLSLKVVDITDVHLAMLREPKYGYGKNMNPCIDCHALMLNIAGRYMQDLGYDFLCTGEVLGQRPMSQTKQSLNIVAKLSGFDGHIIRPLSAKLLEETIPERDGKVDRLALLDIQGRSRKRQMELAVQYGIVDYPSSGGGCLLTEVVFSRRLKDLFDHLRNFQIRDIELLKVGRHFRLDLETKIVVGRNKADNETIQALFKNGDILIKMKNVPGPVVLVPYGNNGHDKNLHSAAEICAFYSDAPNNEESLVTYSAGSSECELSVKAAPRAILEALMI